MCRVSGKRVALLCALCAFIPALIIALVPVGFPYQAKTRRLIAGPELALETEAFALAEQV